MSEFVSLKKSLVFLNLLLDLYFVCFSNVDYYKFVFGFLLKKMNEALLSASQVNLSLEAIH